MGRRGHVAVSMLALAAMTAALTQFVPQANAAETLAPPTITGPSGTVASTSATISVTPAHASHTVECFYNGIDINCPGTWTYNDLEQGMHAVTAQSRNASGDTSPLVYISWKVDTVGPVANVVAPTSLTNPTTVVFNENVSGVTASSVTVRTLTGDAVSIDRTCLTITLESTSCGGSQTRRVQLHATGGWTLGESYRVTVNDTGAATVADSLGNIGALKSATFDAATRVEELGTAHAWRSVANTQARGGSYVVERRPGASVNHTFTGSTLTWLTVTGRSQGRAELYVDGDLRGTFNNYSTKQRFGVERTVKNLGAGQHTAEIRVLGRKGAKSGTDKLVAIDGFKVGGEVDGTPDMTQRWQRVLASAASNGYYSVADLAGAQATIDFAGDSVTVHTANGPRYGEVALYVDGAFEMTADLYAGSLSFGHELTLSGLGSGHHSLTVKVLGTKRAASNGTAVIVDAVSTS